MRKDTKIRNPSGGIEDGSFKDNTDDSIYHYLYSNNGHYFALGGKVCRAGFPERHTERHILEQEQGTFQRGYDGKDYQCPGAAFLCDCRGVEYRKLLGLIPEIENGHRFCDGCFCV